jgi:hypothetical protein
MPALAGESCPTLEWLDLDTGRTYGRCALTALQMRQATFGPFVATGERLWCFAGLCDPQGNLQPKRRLLELGPAQGRPAESLACNFWYTTVEPGWTAVLERALPGWTMLAGSYDARCGLLSPAAGIPEMLVTRAAESPVHLARQVTLPAGRPQLVIEMGHGPESTSRLTVQADGVVCRRWQSQAMKNSQDWQKVQVDLSAMAGRTVTLLITQERTGGGVGYAYWKTIDLQPPPVMLSGPVTITGGNRR